MESSSSFSGSSKRAKAPGNVTQVAHCLVDGCTADLSLCRDYHRRHKVCEAHSKTPKVMIGGREQRFCQQCSRFHSLVEFDEGKRSCRKRLDGHNRRRRKPQPDTLSRNPGLVFPTQQSVTPGTRLLSFSSPQIHPSSSWAHGVVKPENDIVLYTNHHHQQQQQDQMKHYIERQNSFLDHTNAGALGSSSSSHSQKMFCDGLNHEVVGTDRALSLLSSGPPPPVTREFGLNHVHDLHYGGLGQYNHFGEESKGVTVSAAESDASTANFAEMFQQGHEGSSTTGSHQTLTFMWE